MDSTNHDTQGEGFRHENGHVPILHPLVMGKHVLSKNLDPLRIERVDVRRSKVMVSPSS